MQVKKQQLEPDIEQWTGSKLGKEYIKAIYCHTAYLTYMKNTLCKMPDWVKLKLELRLPGEISIPSDIQMTPGGFPGGSDGKESACSVGGLNSIPRSGRSDPLEKGMATHSSILAWRIPWTKEPGRLQSMRSQRGGHDWATSMHTHVAGSKEELKKLLMMKVKEESEKAGLKLNIHPGWIHETSAQAWCTGKTQKDQVEREVGGGIGMGNTCKSMADSCQCMTKPTTIL